jgi:hydroxymethylglutaryl-CoA lyase
MTAGPAGEPMETVKLVECPRDAWQGMSKAIPTAEKVRYLRLLIDCGFRHIDAVSFVSPRYVPQMADSEAVLAELGADGKGLDGIEIIGIVVNEAGLERALRAPQVTTVGYPHSLSAAFLEANAHTTVERSRELAAHLVRECEQAGRRSVIYISMAFGNPYQEAWSPEAVAALARGRRARHFPGRYGGSRGIERDSRIAGGRLAIGGGNRNRIAFA